MSKSHHLSSQMAAASNIRGLLLARGFAKYLASCKTRFLVPHSYFYKGDILPQMEGST